MRFALSKTKELEYFRAKHRAERRAQWICAGLIALGLVAMWAMVGYQLNLLEQVH